MQHLFIAASPECSRYNFSNPCHTSFQFESHNAPATFGTALAYIISRKAAMSRCHVLWDTILSSVKGQLCGPQRSCGPSLYPHKKSGFVTTRKAQMASLVMHLHENHF